MLKLLSLLILVQLAAAACPTGYDDYGSGTCYKVYTTVKNRADATRACTADGGYLANVPNQITNTMLYSTAKSLGVQALWIGLQCQADTATSCEFDGTSTFLTQNSYTNFYPGQPASEVGTCVFMSTLGSNLGKWFSADCTSSDSTAFACSYAGGVNTNDCSTGYSMFNNYCYKVLGPTDEASAEAQCVSECGHITNVLSAYENTFITSLSKNQTITAQTQLFSRIGLKTPDGISYYWEDGTILTTNSYSNFAARSVPDLGYCVGAALANDVVGQGQWLSTKCSDSLISVCKKDKGNACSPSTTSSPTLSPIVCSSPYWYKDNGTFYSPGYPQKTITNVCEYLMYSEPGYIVQISFPNLLLSCTSQIELYNDLTDTVPFKTITPSMTVSPYTYYASSENQMKMIYHSNGCGSGDRWEATFTSQYVRVSSTQLPVYSSGCNNGLLNAPGTITSPNYPNIYNSNTECNYLLGSVANAKVKLHFNFFSTEQGVDLVRVYDADNADKNKVMAVLSGNLTNLRDYVSSSDRMFVRFTSDSLENFQGFSASFTSY